MMKKLLHGLLLSSVLLSTSVFACSADGQDGFLPKNHLRIPTSAKREGGITEQQFNHVIDVVSGVYAPIISQHGGNLEVERNWTDPTVNAYAEQEGSKWSVSMFGGLARHKTITEDGFYLVICHEIGHHLGGVPLYSYKSSWASTEGQADYFSTTKCLRRVWLNEDNKTITSKMDIPNVLKKNCSNGRRTSADDYYLCLRGAMAGLSVSNLFQALGGGKAPKFDTPDPSKVSQTNENHPAAQCRLDTYYQGALCDVSYNEDFSRDSEVTGACHSANGHTVGTRPLCWFHPSER
jgi:hypothetical protein